MFVRVYFYFPFRERLAMATYEDPSTNRIITIAAVSVSSSGDNTIVSAVSGKQIYVLEVLLVSDADDVKIKFESGSTDLTGQMNLSKAGNGFFLPNSGFPRLVTNTGEALVLNLDAAVTVAGYIQYYAE